jgi:hypothetical protein
MSDIVSEFECLLGRAALKLWPDLPRDVQELLFEMAAPTDPTARNNSDIPSRPSSTNRASAQANTVCVMVADKR